jgi:arylsulfatase A-like enzyme
MDTEMGRLLAAVSLTNTHIIFIGDNGTPFQSIQPPYPSNHAKSTIYEGGTRVPWIVAGPAVTTPGQTNFSPVHVADLFSTILEMAGTSAAAAVPSNVTIDSQSILPVVTSGSTKSRMIYNEVFDTPSSTNDVRSLRDSRYKFISFADGRNEFYDLQTDPTELTNLNATASTTQKQYRDRLKFWLYGYTTNSGVTIGSPAMNSGQFSCTVTNVASYALWRCDDLTTQFWSPVTNATVATNGSLITLTDPTPSADRAFYSVVR